MFLVCVSMLNGDTLQLAGAVEELNHSLSLLVAFQWQKRTCFLINHSYISPAMRKECQPCMPYFKLLPP